MVEGYDWRDWGTRVSDVVVGILYREGGAENRNRRGGGMNGVKRS